ncbi:MAG TPA: prenyltransferase, partial [Cellvibrio sp.]|nr:prenyltransferase [Cellvibrio sp.]
IWPREKTTWTTGAILLAADALTEHTGAARLFIQSSLALEYVADYTATNADPSLHAKTEH